MRQIIGSLCFLFAGVCGCSQHEPTTPSNSDPRERVMAWPKDWSGYLGQMVTLEGKAANSKLGALLLGKDEAIWIDGLDSWPVGFYSGDQSKRLRVTGTVIMKDDLPVFVQKPGEPQEA